MGDEHNEREEISRRGGRALKINLGIVIVIMVAEIIGGLLSNSLALIGDAGHMLVDGLALGLGLLALTLARRPATSTKTYGYHRAEIIAALINGTTLWLLAIYIFYESYRRILAPPDVHSPLMLVIAATGLVANVIGVTLLRRTGNMNLNVRAAFWHLIGDTISSVGVITAAIIIMVTGWVYADPIIAIVIGIIILWGAVQLVRESVDILLEAVPKHIEVESVAAQLKEIPGVEDVHDIHVWTITSGIYAMSAHLMITDIMVSNSGGIIEKANNLLVDKFNITHTTLQLECESCPTDNTCGINPHKIS